MCLDCYESGQGSHDTPCFSDVQTLKAASGLLSYMEKNGIGRDYDDELQIRCDAPIKKPVLFTLFFRHGSAIKMLQLEGGMLILPHTMESLRILASEHTAGGLKKEGFSVYGLISDQMYSAAGRQRLLQWIQKPL